MTALRLTMDELTTLRGRELARKLAPVSALATKGNYLLKGRKDGGILGTMPGLRHKYRAQRTEADGIKFASKAEAGYYAYLKAQQLGGKLAFFLMQTRIDIPGGHYRLDFLEFWANGDIRWVDVKGMRLPAFEIKRRAVEALYPFKITIARMTKNGPVFEAAK